MLTRLAALTRRTTKGPLDEDDLLSPTSSITSPLSRSADISPLPGSPVTIPVEPRGRNVTLLPRSATIGELILEGKDLSFLLDAAIYHPLSQLEVPGPFRKPFPPPPSAETPIDQSLAQLNTLLSECDYLRAAHLAASVLTSGTVKSTDAKTIFHLLAIRYSCLELSGNIMLAAQEAKALEDLGSTFYYEHGGSQAAADKSLEGSPPPSKHIMPFALRLQALRLQSIGFSDPRRGVSALYDVGMECREFIAAPSTTEDDRRLWATRLEEIGVRVVNALIVMGDLDCARRTLQTLKPAESTKSAIWTVRMALLYLKMGMTPQLQELIGAEGISGVEKTILHSLIAVSEEHYDEAEALLTGAELKDQPELTALATQNLAVALVYKGEVQKSREMLESLVRDGESFQTLTINLATIYELTSDRARDMKTALTTQIASNYSSSHQPRSFTNADFKL